MTKEMAMESIKVEFMSRYREWLEDVNTLSDMEFGKKWGMGRTERTPHKDSMKAVECFQRYWGISRFEKGWKDSGYPINLIWQLNNEGFLSKQEFWGSRARQLGQSVCYFVSQKVAKEIYRESKKKAA